MVGLANWMLKQILIVQRRLNQLRARVENETGELRWTKRDSVMLLRR